MNNLIRLDSGLTVISPRQLRGYRVDTSKINAQAHADRFRHFRVLLVDDHATDTTTLECEDNESGEVFTLTVPATLWAAS